MIQFSEKLKSKTKDIALRSILLTRSFPRNDETITIRRQLIRSSTSVAANYRSACRGRSDREFYSKLCIAVEELDETLLWMELITDLEIIKNEELIRLMSDIKETLAILSSAKNTMKNKLSLNKPTK